MQMLVRSLTCLYRPISVDKALAFIACRKQSLIKAVRNGITCRSDGHMCTVFNRRRFRCRTLLFGHDNRIGTKRTVIATEHIDLNLVFAEL